MSPFDKLKDVNGQVSLPTKLIIGAIIGLAAYSGYVNNELVGVQKSTVRILERMDMRQSQEFDRLHAEHREQCETLKALDRR